MTNIIYKSLILVGCLGLVFGFLFILPSNSYGETFSNEEQIENSKNRDFEIVEENAKSLSLSIVNLQNQIEISSADKIKIIKEFDRAIKQIKKLESMSKIDKTSEVRNEIQRAITSYMLNHKSSDEVINEILDTYSIEMTDDLINKSVNTY